MNFKKYTTKRHVRQDDDVSISSMYFQEVKECSTVYVGGILHANIRFLLSIIIHKILWTQSIHWAAGFTEQTIWRSIYRPFMIWKNLYLMALFLVTPSIKIAFKSL